MYVNEETVCSSTEELLAEVDKLNEHGIDESYIIGSMDVEALYPSLDIPFTIETVSQMFHQSDVKIEGVDYKELGLYLSPTHTDAELQQKGLKEVCPRRRSNRGPRPTIAGRGMDENEESRNGRWICLLYTSPSPRDRTRSRMPSSA